MLLNEGKGANGARILSPESSREMLRNQLPEAHFEAALDKNIPAVIPHLTNPVHMQPGHRKGWFVCAGRRGSLTAQVVRRFDRRW